MGSDDEDAKDLYRARPGRARHSRPAPAADQEVTEGNHLHGEKRRQSRFWKGSYRSRGRMRWVEAFLSRDVGPGARFAFVLDL